MNATAVMAALNTVEQDHRLVLDRVQALKATVEWLSDRKPEEARQGLLQLQEINKYFVTELACHLEEEEQTLFPLLEQCHAEGKGLVDQLRSEHDRIRNRCQELDDSVQVALELEDGLSRAVLRDVHFYGWRLWEQLDDHAHLETRAVHQCVESLLRGEVATG